MTVDFTPEQESQLSQAAMQNGTGPEELVRNIAIKFLLQESEFLQGVEEGLADAAAGRFVESGEVWASVESLFHS